MREGIKAGTQVQTLDINSVSIIVTPNMNVLLKFEPHANNEFLKSIKDHTH